MGRDDIELLGVGDVCHGIVGEVLHVEERLVRIDISNTGSLDVDTVCSAYAQHVGDQLK